MPGKCSFNNNWLKKAEFASWIMKDENIFKARCSLCEKSFDIANMGEAALTSHAKSKKHSQMVKLNAGSSHLNMKKFFQSSSSSVSAVNCSKTDFSPISTVLPVSNNEVLCSEILWCLKVNDSHMSYNSCKDINLLLQKMFPDSAIAKKFTCGDKKCAYLSCFGIAPYFKSLITQNVKHKDGFVLLFDETLNNKLQLKQMDYYVRIWEEDKVVTRYLSSSFFGHATAEEMLQKLNSSDINSLPWTNLLQLSMDGPNVNWKFFNLFQNQLKSDYDCTALNTGSCGLHIVNGAFKAGSEASEWKVNKLLSSFYFHFHDSPARRENLANLTNSDIFPLQFCGHRWVENVKVAERALVMWNNLLDYVKAVESQKLKHPKNKTFETLTDSANDLLMPAKIACFQSVANIFQPFLTKYQTDKPMLPFLSDDLIELLKNLLVRFLKPEIISNCSKITSYLNLDLSDSSSHLDYHKIDVGFSANKMVKSLKNSKKISDRQYMKFQMEAKQFLITAAKKLLENIPLKYLIIREISCLNPQKMKNKDLCIKKMKNILKILVESKKIAEQLCDTIIFQFRNFLDDTDNAAELAHFNIEENRVDSFFFFFFKLCSQKNCYKDLWKILQMLLLLSHVQASVERGFSVNRQVEVENLKQESLVAQRLINDHIQSVGGVLKVDISKGLLLSAAGARQKYMQHLAELRNKDNMAVMRKRKDVVHDEIKQLKIRKKILETDVVELLKSADDFALKAEMSRNLAMVTKSNSLRKTAKEKQQEMNDLENKLDEKLQELKKM